MGAHQFCTGKSKETRSSAIYCAIGKSKETRSSAIHCAVPCQIGRSSAIHCARDISKENKRNLLRCYGPSHPYQPIGKEKKKVLPSPSLLLSHILPPCFRTISRAMYKPSPKPPAGAWPSLLRTR